MASAAAKRAFRASSSAVTSSSRLHSMTSRPSLTSARPTKMVSVSHSTRMEGSLKPPRKPRRKPRRLRRSRHVQAAHRSRARPDRSVELQVLRRPVELRVKQRRLVNPLPLKKRRKPTLRRPLTVRRKRRQAPKLPLLLIPATETPARAPLLRKPAPLPLPLLPSRPRKPISHTARSRA